MTGGETAPGTGPLLSAHSSHLALALPRTTNATSFHAPVGAFTTAIDSYADVVVAAYSHQTTPFTEPAPLGTSIIGTKIPPSAKESGPGGLMIVYDSYVADVEFSSRGYEDVHVTPGAARSVTGPVPLCETPNPPDHTTASGGVSEGPAARATSWHVRSLRTTASTQAPLLAACDIRTYDPTADASEERRIGSLCHIRCLVAPDPVPTVAKYGRRGVFAPLAIQGECLSGIGAVKRNTARVTTVAKPVESAAAAAAAALVGWVESRVHAPKGRGVLRAATLVGSSSSLSFERSSSPKPPTDFHAPAVTGGAEAPGSLSAHAEHATGTPFTPPFGSNRTSLHPPPDLGTRPIDVASLVYAHHSTPGLAAAAAPTAGSVVSIIGSKIVPAAASELGGSTSLYAAYVGGASAARSAKYSTADSPPASIRNATRMAILAAVLFPGRGASIPTSPILAWYSARTFFWGAGAAEQHAKKKPRA